MFYLPYPPKEKTISAHAALAQLNARMNERANHPLPAHVSMYWHDQPKARKVAA